MTTDFIALAKQAGAICTPVHFSRCIAEFDNQALQAFADLIIKNYNEQLNATTVPENMQDWAGMDGTIAWHLIQRHADNWSDVGKMMGEWLEANRARTTT